MPSARRPGLVHLLLRLLDLRNDVDLLSEDTIRSTTDTFGNTAQALTHVGLVDPAALLNPPSVMRAH